ncbi:MAG TPA: molybdate ABC transporter permease subunit [Deltaproteobacteria bacterium]|nr:MAG: molybdenum ABC transporter permease subunit [Deltaproteobacteria bacterium GWB2_42_7]OGP37884.1 MAG: molybdenum ABC transporter permease subunit [Deltaproteobacteria bacterium GWD2_42_10]OGP48034.1 MAG: molybdenum ABC transporter permease subunit [Deltaproteobacteria bacterium GWF2_42_12]OGQ30491.1 MAG: molybdenum ABC transporter permease subunit [Deltaproteobacteria bacterium RIFCSPHIGHO2_02_FULL_42_44]OGQ35719.1 MAG: molybdenum ABC transporter permease subunit [Deltaproteobacteria bac
MDVFPVYLTLKVSVVATFFSVAIGLALAWLMARKDFWGKGVLDAIIMQPLVIPPTVLGYYLLVLLGRSGTVGRFLEDVLGVTLVFTWKGAVVAAFVASLPLFVRPARAAIEGVDKNMENAARLLGKTEWEVLKTITVPLAWRGIIAGAVMAFARATGEFGATLMVAGNIPGMTQTLSIAIYDAVQMGNTKMANMLVGIITIFSFLVLYFVNRFTKGRY